MLLILVRHGNTFNADQKPTFAGARSDLPLTIAGRDQADAFAEAMDKAGLLPISVLCNQNQRTGKHLEPMTRKLGIRAATPDKRLNEPDFGDWEGKTNDEIDAAGSADERAAWEKEGKWPANANFAPSETDMARSIVGLVGELQSSYDDDKIVVACVGNTALRFLLKTVPGSFETAAKNGALKVSTGNVCAIDYPRDGKPKVMFWNQKPADAPLEDI